MADESFADLRELARELASRDSGIGDSLATAHAAAVRLRERALAAVEAFRDEAASRDATHLARVEVTGVEPDAKHVDAWQLHVRRGRWEIACIAKARGDITLVGPYKRGKPENPCREVPLDGPELERGFDALLLAMLREASSR
jgi:hypothetical protein